MAVNQDNDKLNKDIPLRELLKRKSESKEENKNPLVKKKRKIVIRKQKVADTAPAESQPKVSPPQISATETDADGKVKLVSSLSGSASPKGPIRNVSQSFLRTAKPSIQEEVEVITEEQISSQESEIPQTATRLSENDDGLAQDASVEIDEVVVTEKTAEETDSETGKKKKPKDKKEEIKNRRYSKLEKEEEHKIEKVLSQVVKPTTPAQRTSSVPKEIDILETISVGEIARKLNLKASEVIAQLMKMGVMATINQTLDSDTASLLAAEFGANVNIVSLYDETIIEQEQEDREEDHIYRPPVVTIMGHVDHGKTKLLDAVRISNVASGEAGGITQHIGAYQVNVNGKKVTFLDTPGHEAFTLMRSRGAEVTDLVILVVAADDGVMPQTLEAINHAKEAKVPILVAINKIDKEGANPDRIKQELSNYGLIPEAWGGDTIFVEISALLRQNIEQLMEMILIQAEMLDLKANPKVNAKGSVIEAKLDQGRGPVATVLIQQGNLSVGDPFVAGVFFGRVRAIFNDLGQKIEKAYPADPVEIIGLTGVPDAGDPFESVESEKYAKQICQKRQELKRHEESQKIQRVTLENLNEMIAKGDVKELKVVIKADMRGSAEALRDALQGLSNKQVNVKCIHAGTGAINESDIMLASTSNALVVGFHVRPNNKASELAVNENIDMKFYNVIYNAVDDIRNAMEGLLDSELHEHIAGQGEIRDIFKISKIGTIAGAYVTSGTVARSHRIRIIREGEIVFDGVLKSLKRFKEDTNEVAAGFECGFSLSSFNDLREGDRFETYQIKEVKQLLQND